jgi:hypothetical protein
MFTWHPDGRSGLVIRPIGGAVIVSIFSNDLYISIRPYILSFYRTGGSTFAAVAYKVGEQVTFSSSDITFNTNY